eukprot:GHVT01005027.1.p1 GENE.GHVT01005027.1~~GHVT01005027.1.p1  ORF type:complete len:536 (+),score=59.94 GHVT01005027.1:1022-2629(+)
MQQQIQRSQILLSFVASCVQFSTIEGLFSFLKTSVLFKQTMLSSKATIITGPAMSLLEVSSWKGMFFGDDILGAVNITAKFISDGIPTNMDEFPAFLAKKFRGPFQPLVDTFHGFFQSGSVVDKELLNDAMKNLEAPNINIQLPCVGMLLDTLRELRSIFVSYPAEQISAVLEFKSMLLEALENPDSSVPLDIAEAKFNAALELLNNHLENIQSVSSHKLTFFNLDPFLPVDELEKTIGGSIGAVADLKIQLDDVASWKPALIVPFQSFKGDVNGTVYYTIPKNVYDAFTKTITDAAFPAVRRLEGHETFNVTRRLQSVAAQSISAIRQATHLPEVIVDTSTILQILASMNTSFSIPVLTTLGDVGGNKLYEAILSFDNSTGTWTKRLGVSLDKSSGVFDLNKQATFGPSTTPPEILTLAEVEALLSANGGLGADMLNSQALGQGPLGNLIYGSDGIKRLDLSAAFDHDTHTLNTTILKNNVGFEINKRLPYVPALTDKAEFIKDKAGYLAGSLHSGSMGGLPALPPINFGGLLF